MQTASATLSLERSKAYRAIFWGGSIAGVLDIAAAFVNSGLRDVKPMRVLQAIASGLLGPDAFTGGIATTALGAVLHFFIATVATAVYYPYTLRRFAHRARRAQVLEIAKLKTAYIALSIINHNLAALS